MNIPRTQLIAYGQLGLVMAFVGLPIYVHAPKFYAEVLGLPLALLGLLLFIPRFVDAIQDPYIGLWSDRLAGRGFSRLKIILLSSPILALSFFGLFAPPALSATLLGAWMVALLIIVYTAFSFITINMSAMGVEWSSDAHQRTRITAWREGFLLFGLLVASALPQVLLEQTEDDRTAYFQFGVVFIILLLLGLLLLWLGLRRTQFALQSAAPQNYTLLPLLKSNPRFQALLWIGLLNATAAAIPGALVLFYIEDVVQAPNQMGFFLAVYFLSGALGMPFWLWLSKRTSKRIAWLISMVLSVIAFAWAFSLGAGDVTAYYIICVLSGLCLGADYALPPALIADVIATPDSNVAVESGAYMGVWVFFSKLALAISAVISLPLLSVLGYDPAMETKPADALFGLAVVYALLPCVFKLAAAWLLWKRNEL